MKDNQRGMIQLEMDSKYLNESSLKTHANYSYVPFSCVIRKKDNTINKDVFIKSIEKLDREGIPYQLELNTLYFILKDYIVEDLIDIYGTEGTYPGVEVFDSLQNERESMELFNYLYVELYVDKFDLTLRTAMTIEEYSKLIGEEYTESSVNEYIKDLVDGKVVVRVPKKA